MPWKFKILAIVSHIENNKINIKHIKKLPVYFLNEEPVDRIDLAFSVHIIASIPKVKEIIPTTNSTFPTNLIITNNPETIANKAIKNFKILPNILSPQISS